MTCATTNPYTEQVVTTYDEYTDAELAAVLARAEAACGARAFDQRAQVLTAVAALLRESSEDLARLITGEMGKLIGESRDEVEITAAMFEHYARHGEVMLAPRSLPLETGQTSVTSYPIGVVFAVEPWNLPFYQVARVAVPALMAGNTVVVKHASGVPACAEAIEDVLLAGGAPAGAYTNVRLSNAQAATAIADERVRGVALTGSGRAGSSVAASAGKALKKSTMELGDADAFAVLDDADLNLAVSLAVAGRMNNTGQAYAAAKRFVVHRDLEPEFTRRFAAVMAALPVGDPLEESTILGPLSSAGALETILGQLDAAMGAGARVITGGHRVDRTGFFLKATVLTDVRRDNPTFHQGLFAPVAMVFPVADEAEAIAVANDSPFGLGGSVITGDVERGQRVAAAMETGMVFVNDQLVTVTDR